MSQRGPRSSFDATAADFNRKPAAASTSRVYIPLEHFFAVASQFMPAFLQAASVLGVVPAKAGAATATIRLKAIIDTSAFIYISSDADCTTIQAPKGGVETATQCHAKISRSGILPRCTRDCPEGTRPSKPNGKALALPFREEPLSFSLLGLVATVSKETRMCGLGVGNCRLAATFQFLVSERTQLRRPV